MTGALVLSKAGSTQATLVEAFQLIFGIAVVNLFLTPAVNLIYPAANLIFN
jgi:hypothetical protein